MILKWLVFSDIFHTRVEKIVRSLKYLSRDGSGDPFVEVTFRDIITSVIELIQERLNTQQVQFSIEGDLDVILYCQPVSLSQVFLNLMTNSIDAISQIENSWIKCIIESKDQNKIFRFIDSGSGIPKVVQEKIFHPFFTTKEVGSGTGLGLSISKGIIKNHFGDMWIDHQCANTCFVITLPCGQKDLKAG